MKILFLIALFIITIITIITITTFVCNNTWWPNHIIVSNKLKKTLVPLLPINWKISEVDSFTAERTEKGVWKIYVKITNIKTNAWTNDFVEFKLPEKIIVTRLFDSIDFWDLYSKEKENAKIPQ
jgi:hypothetical protein